ncbi:MAG: phosphoribosylformylglycinamidine (FGAM) synthase-like enzyme [Phycisphaerales bacterium]|jgi:phosphoribosylformylglycinamidine (FGAM) synthase-like enzyme/phosphoribosylformylglycinamidine (FGAM) synthase PurS component
MSTPATSTPTTTPTTPLARVHRVEIRPTVVAGDPRGQTLRHELAQRGFAPGPIRTAKVYLIEAALDKPQLDSVLCGLLAGPVVETAFIGATPCPPGASLVEVHPLPGVMDPAAQSVAAAIESLTGTPATVSTGTRYEIEGLSEEETLNVAQRVLANPVVNGIHTEPFSPQTLPHGHHYDLSLRHVSILGLDDAALQTLSRDAHLFLSLEEMRAIQTEFRTLDREPTDIELETLAQTWSEHCVHKTLKSNISYTPTGTGSDPIDWTNRPGHVVNSDGSVTITNLLKSTVAAATFELIEDGVDWTLSVFVDNAGIIAFDDDLAVCVKVETHNHPSAIEPYGGAATGIGGCIRDIIGTGMAAKPIASTDVFCVGTPDIEEVPAGCLHPKRVLTEVVGGVRDYGNRMGIPTVNGAVWFDDRYVGNPLVYVGCVGVMPIHLISGDAQPGDRIIALGGRTGRDGIHGATFSSAELTDTHADEFSHAVQIGNAIEEKRTLDAILRARDFVAGEGSGTRDQASGGDEDKKSESKPQPLFTSITDCGAGGFSSAVGEMGEKIGADVHLDRAPLKYDGLSYTEIWISEAQERMVLAVPAANVAALQQICDEEHVELADLGSFGTDNTELVLNFRGTEVGRLPMAFMHDGIPTPTREATWDSKATGIRHQASEKTELAPSASDGSLSSPTTPTSPTTSEALLTLLAHPNIASKHFIIRQYDHEVQGNTVAKPLVGPKARGPGDAAIVEPAPGSNRGLAIACGLATGLEADPYLMTLAAIDECVRNLVCVGADPDRIAILDNFCWPSCNKPENLGSLVRAAEGCYDGAMAYRTPFVSGKDSLNNQFTVPAKDGEPARTIEIPPTLLISGIGIVPELDKAISMDAKKAGNVLIEVGPSPTSLAGSHYAAAYGTSDTILPALDLELGPRLARMIHGLINQGLVRSAHDVSDGGLLCAIAEMCIAGSTEAQPIGAEVTSSDPVALFGESPSRYVLEIAAGDLGAFTAALGELPHRSVATLNDSGAVTGDGFSATTEALAEAWTGTLDW